MRQLPTRSWAYPSLLALVLISVAVVPLARDLTELLAFIYPDAEHLPPEEELLLIEDIFISDEGLSPENIRLLADLSFVSDEELSKIRLLAKTGKISRFHSYNFSPATEELVRIIVSHKRENKSKFRINQLSSFSDDVRYRWRTRYDSERFKAGLLLERDPGEEEIFDYYSGYLSGKSASLDWIIGDHQLTSGYGLNLWRSAAGFKSFETMSTVHRQGSGIRPYRSSNEAWSLRGVALSTKQGNLKMAVSISSNGRDGYFNDAGVPVVNYSGIHNSESTLERRNSLRERVICSAVEYQLAKVTAGGSLSDARWTGKAGSRKDYRSSGIHMTVNLSNVKIFTELTYGINGNNGIISGMMVSAENIKYSVIGRSYESGFRGIRSNPLSEWSNLDKNEIGIYQGFEFRRRGSRLLVYSDIYRQHSSGIGSSPASGAETALRWEARRSRGRLRFQAKQEIKTAPHQVNFQGQAYVTNSIKYLYKTAYYLDFSKRLSMKAQASHSVYSDGKAESSGEGLAATLRWKGDSWRIELDWVRAWVGDYNSRLYFWDLNLPGEMRSRMYSAGGNYPGLKFMQIKDSHRIALRIRMMCRPGELLHPEDYEGGLFIESNL